MNFAQVLQTSGPPISSEFHVGLGSGLTDKASPRNYQQPVCFIAVGWRNKRGGGYPLWLAGFTGSGIEPLIRPAARWQGVDRDWSAICAVKQETFIVGLTDALDSVVG